MSDWSRRLADALCAGRLDSERLYLGVIDFLEDPHPPPRPPPPQVRAWLRNGWDPSEVPDDGSWPACPTPWAPDPPPGALPGTPAPWWPRQPRSRASGPTSPPPASQPRTRAHGASQPLPEDPVARRRALDAARHQRRVASESLEQREVRLARDRERNRRRYWARRGVDPPAAPDDPEPLAEVIDLHPGGSTPT